MISETNDIHRDQYFPQKKIFGNIDILMYYSIQARQRNLVALNNEKTCQDFDHSLIFVIFGKLKQSLALLQIHTYLKGKTRYNEYFIQDK